MFLQSFIIINFLIYFITLIWYIVGIIKASRPINHKGHAFNQEVSVIVCVKDGATSLSNLLNDLESQKYVGKHEFIIVDDCSQDASKEIINQFIKKDNRFKYISSNIGMENLKYKKKALDAGIKSAQYELLLFTDVDCRVQKNWIASMINSYNINADYIIGYSKVEPNHSIVSYFQSMDFKMMMFCSMGAVNMGTPHGCSGQNQSYKKEVFIKNNGFNKISNLLQGDDSIFLQLSNNSQNIKTVFSLDKDSFVTAKTHNKWADFIKQRLRWSGDAQIMWRYNIIFYLAFIGFFLTNFLVLASPLIYYFGFHVIIFFILIKFIIELLLFYFGSLKIREKINIFSFILWFLLHTPYVVLMGLMGPFIPMFKWRGRKIA